MIVIAIVLASLRALAADDPGRELVGGMFGLRHKLYWQGEKPTLPSYLPTNNTFLRWVSGSMPSLPRQSRLNCWEAVFAGAIEAGLLTKGQVAAAYLSASRHGRRSFIGATPRGERRQIAHQARAQSLKLLDSRPELWPAATAGHERYLGVLAKMLGNPEAQPKQSYAQLRRQQLRAGDVVVYYDGDTVAHMAVALGKRARSGDHKLVQLIQVGDKRRTSKLRVLAADISFGPETTVRVVRPDWRRLRRQGRRLSPERSSACQALLRRRLPKP